MFGTNKSPHNISTKIVTVYWPVQPAALVPVTVYSVVIVGLAIGLGQSSQSNPSEGVQTYVSAPVAVNWTVSPAIIVDDIGVATTGIFPIELTV